MECVICGTDSGGKTCSGACRAKLSRRTRQEAEPARARSHNEALQHYHDNPDMYIKRNEPDKLNWGPHLDAGELHDRGFTGNRQTIPGDHDYQPALSVGPPELLPMTDLTGLPDGVSLPTGQPTATVRAMTPAQLTSRLRASRDWTGSPEYAEVIHRLLTKTVDELKESGQFVPEWKAA